MTNEDSPRYNNTEQEEKVDIEEASVNLNCVKKEIEGEDFQFAVNRYRIGLTYENIFGETSNERRANVDSLIDFLDDDVIMETKTGTIKLEDVKDENRKFIRKTIEQSYCNKCGGNYEGYCPDCSSLSHILNNLTPNINPEPDLNTTPINTLEIREVSRGKAVFALKSLPKGIILGPFEGIAPIESTTGLQWKIKDKKLANDENGNWMKYIESVANDASKNLDVFQFDGILYFETSREIEEDEELLVCYNDEKEGALTSDRDEESYLVPEVKEEYPKVFACTLCCLGFRLKTCLVEHKSKCPQEDHDGSIADFEITQCPCCKVWLEEQEHLKSHMLPCLDNYKLLRNLPDFQGGIAEGRIGQSREQHVGDIHSKTNVNEYRCCECSFQTKYKRCLKVHLNTHNDIKTFECDICKKGFNQKGNLKLHIENTHSNTSEREYKCPECSFQTNDKASLKVHRNTHNDTKTFECDICKKTFSWKNNLCKHIRTQHSNTNEKEYKCFKCSYETNNKENLKSHLNTHSDIKAFECDICKNKFTRKDHLKVHIKNLHINKSTMVYKCSESSYQTNSKNNTRAHLDTHKKEYHLKPHLNKHTDTKPFECYICKKGYDRKDSLKLHIINHHSNTTDKEYKCSECSFQTNRKGNLKAHLNTHTDIKPLECDICKKGFNRNSNLIFHIKNQHSNMNEKEYKCSKCIYETNYKNHFKRHVRRQHIDIKCDICEEAFTHKLSLKTHIQNVHLNKIEKNFKCAHCSYQTNRKPSLKLHLNTHSGVKSFQCDICEKKFKYGNSLKRHIKDKHSNTSEMEYK